MREEILALEERLRLGDAGPEPDTSAVFDELLADDVRFVQPSGSSVGKSMVLAGHRPPRKRSFVRVENSDVVLESYGEVVMVTMRTQYVLPDRSFAFRTVRLWRRYGASWRVALVVLMDADEPSS